jgi:hypothetical protein
MAESGWSERLAMWLDSLDHSQLQELHKDATERLSINHEPMFLGFPAVNGTLVNSLCYLSIADR